MREIIKRAAPNRHQILLEKVTDRYGACWLELTTPDCCDGADPRDYSMDEMNLALIHFDDWVRQYSRIPNWEVQIEYDELHGTVNGGDPMIELFRGEY